LCCLKEEDFFLHEDFCSGSAEPVAEFMFRDTLRTPGARLAETESLPTESASVTVVSTVKLPAKKTQLGNG